MTEEQTTLKIQTLNDSFRATGKGGIVLITRGISEKYTDEQTQKISVLVRQYKDFTPDNDPYGEHDFGSFQYEGEKFFWKIDYYASDMMHGSENPADEKQTKRVLTIMLAQEY